MRLLDYGMFVIQFKNIGNKQGRHTNERLIVSKLLLRFLDRFLDRFPERKKKIILYYHLFAG